MEKFDFNKCFIQELSDAYSCEQQILEALPTMIKACSSSELKEALQNHFEETENQVLRLRNIFDALDEYPHEEECMGMAGILQEGEEFINRMPKSTLKDAFIIGAAQKVEHYEIALYGTLYSHAKSLDMDKDILNLLDETLQEEGNADKKLTELAEGSFFTSGINQAACEFVMHKSTQRSRNSKIRR